LSSLHVVGSVVRGNTAIAAVGGGLGGGVWTSSYQPLDFIDCAITGNTATAADAGTAGSGGGVCVAHGKGWHWSVAFSRCTIANNSATGHDGLPAGDGGGLWIDPNVATVDLSHTIVAGNAAVSTGGAPDCSGPISSLGYNLIGDTTGCTITGDGTGNQLDVDPLFIDPGNGDFTLRSDSPALDAGDPAVRVAGADAAGNPRVLDGDLDRKMVVDLGAYEFDNVHLEVTGQATPGGTLTFTTTGTAALPILMLVGSVPGDLLAPPFGTLFLDFTDPWLLLSWGSVPDQRSWSVDPSIPVPSEWILQPLVLDAATHAGNLGNAVVVALE
jgi:hypothetical protein